MVDELERFKEAIADRYLIERELGRGGMATVYLATDLRHGRLLAIKILRSDLSGSMTADRFHREIEIAASLQHPQILPLHDSGTAAGLHYYTMPYVDGESLRERIEREGPLPVGEAVRIARQVGKALAYAHRQGVIHRDVKPGNILLSSGEALVADFGVAAALGAAGGDRLTQTGIAVGTPTYMSPEQSGGEKVTGRSDQYSLACVLYEMLTGQPPFVGKTAVVISRHVLDPVPPISSVRASVPVGVEEAIMRALEKIPADRFATTDAFVDALRDGESTETGLTGAQRAARLRQHRKRRTRLLIGGGAAIAVAAAAVAFWPSGGEAPAPALDRTNVAVLYFDDRSPDGDLGYLADGLTEALISELANVRGLRVVSRNGVKPYRNVDLPPDSLARLLTVGHMVSGTVERKADSLVANVVLEDRTGFEVQNARIARAGTDLVLLRDEIVAEAKRQLGQALGRQLQQRAIRATTRSDEAWQLYREAARRREDADHVRWALNDQDAAAGLLAEADSLLAEAEEADPDWLEPIIARGWAAADRGRLPLRGGKSSWNAAALREAIGHADRALERSPDNPEALELRGSALYDLTWPEEVARDSAEVRRIRAGAERDLDASIQADSMRALAWVALAQLKRSGGEFAEASVDARHALDADPFLVNAEAFILIAMAQTWLDLREMELAKQWNEEGRRRYPAYAQFTAAQLVMMAGWDGWENAVDTAWSLASDPGLQRWNSRGLVVAAVLAREGLRDSARAVIDRVRADTEGSTDPFLDYYEAEARMQLGEPEEAIRLLGLYLQASPNSRSYIKEDWWWEALADNPDFQALVTETP